MQFVQPQQPLAQAQIAVQDRQVRVDSGDQAVVDGDRDIVWVERGLDGRIVFAGAREEDVALDLRAERRGEGIDADRGTRRASPRRLPCARSVLALQELGDVVALRELDLLAALVFDLGQLEVGVVEHLEDALGGGSHLVGLRQQRLHLRGEDMWPLAVDFI